MEVVVLGSGTSYGVPVIGCSCPVCTSPDSRDTRYRASVYIRSDSGAQILIDAGPEFRLQALRAGITALDAILLTHAHADHLHGLDDVRPLTHEKTLPVYGNEQTIGEFMNRFSYIFHSTQKGGGKPHIKTIIVSPAAGTTAAFNLGPLGICPIPVKHGNLDILGWKITENHHSFVYVTDVSFIPPGSLELIQKPDLLIIGALREKKHDTHFNFTEALETIRTIAPRQAFFTHLSHDKLHTEILSYIASYALTTGFDPHAQAAWDGLTIRL